MNTNAEQVGVTVSLTKVNNDVTLTIVAGSGVAASVVLDDSKTVYSALHDAKDDLAGEIAGLLDAEVDGALFRTPGSPNTITDFGKIDVLMPSGAAAILDGQQVASPVAQPDAVPETVPDGALPKSKKGKSVPPPKDAMPSGAAAILDGQQVASPVAQPDAVPETVPDGALPKSKKGKSVPPPKDAA